VSRDGTFADVLAGNEAYAHDFRLGGLEAVSARGLAVLTCMDSRIEPLKMLGLAPGDAKILRNAGARVTDDVLRTLVLASYLLGVDRAMVVAHTECRMASGDERTVCNLFLFMLTRWGRFLEPPAGERPNLRAHFLRTTRLPGVRRMIEEQALELPEFARRSD